jgi:inosine-uridine nucleoside N-ribohydrolase
VRTKILLDTDIDILGDIDDALCLGYLLRQPACDLVGITTVSWDTEQRARVASAMCRAAAQDIPIVPGARVPLVAPLPQVAGGDGVDEDLALARWPHAQSFPRGQAVEFMRRTIHDNPGEIVLLAIGPLTNLALLFAIDPEVPALLRSLVLMGGRFSNDDRSEWNATFDPHATAMVYRARVRVHRSIGLDVTEAITLDSVGIRGRIELDASDPLRDWIAVWLQHRPTITFHDPLTAVTVFDATVCRFETGRVEVEYTDRHQSGVTRWHPGDPSKRHQVAVDVDRERFLQYYFGVI